MRRKGSRNTLIRIDYDSIGHMAGLAGDTAKQYAQGGEYDPRDLESVLKWVNSRRALNGMPLIGLPVEKVTAEDSDCSVVSMPSLAQNRGFYYDPLLGDFRWAEIVDGTAFRR